MEEPTKLIIIRFKLIIFDDILYILHIIVLCISISKAIQEKTRSNNSADNISQTFYFSQNETFMINL